MPVLYCCTGEKELFLQSARRRVEAKLRSLLRKEPPAEAVNAALAELEQVINFCFSDEAVETAVQRGLKYLVQTKEAFAVYCCLKCGRIEGFIEILTHCTVTRRVNGELNHVETLDWEATGETVRTYRCVNCGAKWLEWELDDDEEQPNQNLKKIGGRICLKFITFAFSPKKSAKWLRRFFSTTA